MEDEIKALEKPQTWELVNLPKGNMTVGCKWEFTMKHKPDRSVDRYMAHLVAKGYTKTFGIDYHQ